MAFNPFAAVPVAFGIILMKIVGYLQEAASLGDPGTDVQGIMTSYQYVFDKLFSDREVIAYIIVFTLVILITYGISRLSVDYSWYIAIAAGAVVNVIGLAVQASSVEGMNLMMVIVGSVLGGLLAALIHFMGCTLDYGKKEMLQFEDDDYYYYVKAIPKIQITQAERTVKTFGRKKSPKKSKKSKKTEEFTEQPMVADGIPNGDTTVAVPGQTPPEEKPVNNNVVGDFDELSFDGFDFDELDQK